MKRLLRQYRIYRSLHFCKCLFFNIFVAVIVVPLSLWLAIKGEDLVIALWISVAPLILLPAVYPFTYLSLMDRIDRSVANSLDSMTLGVLTAAIIAALTVPLVFGFGAVIGYFDNAHDFGITNPILFRMFIIVYYLLIGLFCSLFSLGAAPVYAPVGIIFGYLNYHFLKNTQKETIEQALQLTQTRLI